MSVVWRHLLTQPFVGVAPTFSPLLPSAPFVTGGLGKHVAEDAREPRPVDPGAARGR